MSLKCDVHDPKSALLNESIDQNQRQLEGYLNKLEELANRISELVLIVVGSVRTYQRLSNGLARLQKLYHQ